MRKTRLFRNPAAHIGPLSLVADLEAREGGHENLNLLICKGWGLLKLEQMIRPK